MNNKRVFLVLALTLFSTSGFAAEDYRCTVERISAADEKSAGFQLSKKAYIGREFTVDRGSGLMVGALKNSFRTQPQVIDRGSKDNSFKVVTTMNANQSAGPGTSVYMLVIDEFVQGTAKPFAYMEHSMIYFGHCDRF